MDTDPVAEIFRRKETAPQAPGAPEERGGRSGTFGTLPTFKKQQNWKYVLSADGEENVLGLDSGSSRYAWRFKGVPATSSKNKSVSPLRGWRAPDPEDLSPVGKVLAKGVFQVHRGDAGSLYGTMQDGKLNNSVKLTEGKGGRWVLSPTVRKSIQKPSEALFRRATRKRAFVPNPYSDRLPEMSPVKVDVPTTADVLAYPLVAPPGGNVATSLLLGAGLGAAGGAAYHTAGTVRRAVTGSEKPRPGLVKRMLLGGAIGAGASAVGNTLVKSTPRNIRLLPGSDPTVAAG